mgnify:CR=1 FL=1|tara:strand:- start:5907 stop:6350 length:444 start_codon:yes stop_codon:yes gene_type:complete
MDNKKYTCWHCKTGIVHRLPATCPECDRRLTKEVKKREKKRRQRLAASAIAALLMACGRPSADDTAVDAYKAIEACTEHPDGAQYTLQAYAASKYTGITAAIGARDEGPAVYIDLEPTHISTYYTANIMFIDMACDDRLQFTYKPIL